MPGLKNYKQMKQNKSTSVKDSTTMIMRKNMTNSSA